MTDLVVLLMLKLYSPQVERFVHQFDVKLIGLLVVRHVTWWNLMLGL